jgi:hypothetical protein
MRRRIPAPALVAQWSDLVSFEIVPVVKGSDVAEILLGAREPS